MKLFGEQHITQIFRANVQRMLNIVNGLNDSQLLGVSKEEIIREIYKSLKEEPIAIDFTNKRAEINMTKRPGSSYPPGTDVQRSKMYPAAEVTYIFENDITSTKFLNAIPTRTILNRVVYGEVDRDNNLRMSYLTKYARVELSDAVKKEVKDWITNLIPQLEATVTSINEEITAYNKEISVQLDKIVSERIEIAKQKKRTNDDLADF